jgi:hypothetical protein
MDTIGAMETAKDFMVAVRLPRAAFSILRPLPSMCFLQWCTSACDG